VVNAYPTPEPSPTLRSTNGALPLFSIEGPPDAAWCRKVRELPAHAQVAVVLAKLKELNPDFDGETERVRIMNGQVVELRFYTDAVTDIRPVQALSSLKSLGCVGSAPGLGRLTDLGPISSLSLDWLFLWHNPDLKDFSPLKRLRLVQFEASWTGFSSLADVASDRMLLLNIQHTAVKDVTELPDYPHLTTLFCNGCDLRSIEPMRHSGVREVLLDYLPRRDAAVLRSMKGLQKVNQVPIDEFWRRHPDAGPPQIPEPS
jgi:hypothetical protein